MVKIRKLSDFEASLYLKVYAKTGNHVLAGEVTGIKKNRVMDRARRDPWFNEQLNEARQLSVERLEGEAYRRAVIGVDEPLYYQGEIFGTVKKYSDKLLLKLLEVNDERYSPKLNLNVNRPMDLSKLSDSELATLERLLSKTSPD